FDAGPRPLDQVSSASPNAAKLAAVAVPAPLDEPEAKGAADRPGRPQPFNGKGVAMRDELGKCRAARCGGQAFDEVAVFGGVGDAVERPEGFAAGTTVIGGLGFVEGLRIADHHGVERGWRPGAVVSVDSGEVGVYQFNGGRLTCFQGSAQLRNGDFGDFDHGRLRLTRCGANTPFTAQRHKRNLGSINRGAGCASQVMDDLPFAGTATDRMLEWARNDDSPRHPSASHRYVADGGGGADLRQGDRQPFGVQLLRRRVLHPDSQRDRAFLLGRPRLEATGPAVGARRSGTVRAFSDGQVLPLRVLVRACAAGLPANHFRRGVRHSAVWQLPGAGIDVRHRADLSQRPAGVCQTPAAGGRYPRLIVEPGKRLRPPAGNARPAPGRCPVVDTPATPASAADTRADRHGPTSRSRKCPRHPRRQNSNRGCATDTVLSIPASPRRATKYPE
nr:hypothetical protein [Tanacetum cinerariifolium]